MLASRSRSDRVSFSWSPVTVALGLSAVALAARAVVGTHTPLGALRAAVSLGAFAFVACGRRGAFAKRAALALVLEGSVGLVTFVCVDVPFVRHHTPQFALATADGYGRLFHRDLVADLDRLGLLPR